MFCDLSKGQTQISESQKKEIVKIIFKKIDSTTYKSSGFGLVNNSYLLEKPEIKILIPEMDSLYDTLKREINIFLEKNKAYLPFHPNFNESLLEFFDDKNYNDLEFYYFGIIFTGLSIYRENKDFVNRIDSFDKYILEAAINRHMPKLHFALEKYIDSGYIDDLKEGTTFWHKYSYKKDGVTFNKCIIVYFFPNKYGHRVLNINRADYW